MTLAYILNIDFYIYCINIDTQKINRFTFAKFGMIVANFQRKD